MSVKVVREREEAAHKVSEALLIYLTWVSQADGSAQRNAEGRRR